MIFLTGDLHGVLGLDRLDTFLAEKGKTLTRDDYLIILGDFGMIWSADTQYGYLVDKLTVREYFEDKYPWTTLFIDGNHENFVHLKKFPKKIWGGADVGQLSEHCLWLRRGRIYTVDGRTFLTVGGAYSIDKLLRYPLVSWWKDEAITRRDINRARLSLAEHRNKVDYILTHCAPTPVHQEIARQERFTHASKEETKNEALLQEINELAAYKQWYFGHYHLDRSFADGKFVCLYETIVEL